MNIFIEWLYAENKTYNPLIERSVQEALSYEGVQVPVELSVSIVDNDQIQMINLEQRQMDKPTDVLSFPMIEFEGYDTVSEAIMAEPINPESGEVYLGDIVVSWDKVVEQSESYGHNQERELSFLIVHSMLHLLGYDHMVPDEEQVMLEKQKAIMGILGIER